MARILILYGTAQGQTAKIAQRISDVLKREGNDVEVFPARQLPSDFTLVRYDAILIGASMHAGGYQRSIVAFVKRHHAELAAMPNGFFSVSLTEAYPTAEQRALLDSHIARFSATTNWHPTHFASFAGALAYTRYNPLERLAMQQIARQVNAPTDTSHDVEYTNWQAVEAFAAQFAAELPIKAANG